MSVDTFTPHMAGVIQPIMDQVKNGIPFMFGEWSSFSRYDRDEVSETLHRVEASDMIGWSDELKLFLYVAFIAQTSPPLDGWNMLKFEYMTDSGKVDTYVTRLSTKETYHLRFVVTNGALSSMEFIKMDD